MKKIVAVVVIVLVMLSVSSCQANIKVDDSINAMFFTANHNASLVPNYLNLIQGQKIEEPAKPTRQGFSFTGWYKDYYKTEQWDFTSDTIVGESMVFYAGREPSIFTITYVLNGGTMPSEDYVN